MTEWTDYPTQPAEHRRTCPTCRGIDWPEVLGNILAGLLLGGLLGYPLARWWGLLP